MQNMVEAYEREQHYNIDAEKAVLGCILLENDLINESPLQKEFFYEHHEGHHGIRKHANLFATMKDLAAKKMPIDLVTILERLGNNPDNLAGIGGLAYLSELAGEVMNTKNFQTYAEIIIHHYKKREMMKLGVEMQQGMEDEEVDKRLQEIQHLGQKQEKKSKAEVIAGIIQGIEENDGVIRGARYGMRDLDTITNGLNRQEFVVVGARPSMGKTAFAVNTMTNCAESPDNLDGAAVAFFAAEQPETQIMKRALCKEGNLDLNIMRMGRNAFQPEDWRKLSMASGIIGGMNFEIFDKPGMDMNYIRYEARQMRKKNKDKDLVIVIDYLQMIKGNIVHRGNRTAEVGEIAQDCKIMARELDCTVISLAQLSRGVEQRQDKRPMMSDLRDSGEIEQAADVTLFLYRDSYYDAESADQNMLEIIVAKQREGATGSAKVAFIKEFGKLVNIDWSHHDSHASQKVTKLGHVDDKD